jgi:hypothetical protein
MKHAYVEIEGPFGYSDLRIVKTGSNATVTFNIPDNEILMDAHLKSVYIPKV